MAAALEKVIKEKRYDGIKLIKPIVTKSRLGEDIGFLPGSVRRKLIPKMRPFIEKLRQFSENENILSDDGYNRLLDSGVIELMNNILIIFYQPPLYNVGRLARDKMGYFAKKQK